MRIHLEADAKAVQETARSQHPAAVARLREGERPRVSINDMPTDSVMTRDENLRTIAALTAELMNALGIKTSDELGDA